MERGKKKVNKMSRLKKRAAKPADKHIDMNDSDSDEETFVPDEIEMLSYDHGTKLQEIE